MTGNLIHRGFAGRERTLYAAARRVGDPPNARITTDDDRVPTAPGAGMAQRFD